MSEIPQDGQPVGRVPLATNRDVARARKAVGAVMDEGRARPIQKTRFVTAVSEITRNAIVHGGGGVLMIYAHALPRAISVACRDEGGGIKNVEEAMRDGFSTAGSLGRGLGGAKRLVDAFEIESTPGGGTTVRMMSRT